MTRRPHPDQAFEVQRDDVQSLALQGHGELPEACYLLVRSSPNGDLAGWTREIAPLARTGDARTPEAQHALNVAFSHAGLEAMNVASPTRAEFCAPFREGMSAVPHRSWDLGDVDDSAPSRWTWGGPGAPVHALLVLLAERHATLDGLVDLHRERLARFALDLACPPIEAGWPRAPGVLGLREHFGFVDGVSQPEFRTHATPGSPDELMPGELLLGYPGESGQLSSGPTVRPSRAALDAGLAITPDGRCDLGRNGTYLVLRQLEQRVHDFWEFAAGHASDTGSIERCAAKLIGRWRNGAPLTASSTQPTDFGEFVDANDFLFAADDADGFACPIGSHVRRANPRDTLPHLAPRESLREVRRRRILRRGRPFGPPVPGWPDPAAMLQAPRDDARRGLVFICLNADIQRQFEFVQQRWINDPTFANARVDEVDPILGRQRAAPRFIVPEPGGAVVLGRGTPPLARFTRVLGGEYFFLPGRRALAWLATANRDG